MICASLGGAELWATQGGLIGLVTMALFVTVFTFIRVITRIVADDRVERKDVRQSNEIEDRTGVDFRENLQNPNDIQKNKA